MDTNLTSDRDHGAFNMHCDRTFDSTILQFAKKLNLYLVLGSGPKEDSYSPSGLRRVIDMIVLPKRENEFYDSLSYTQTET